MKDLFYFFFNLLWGDLVTIPLPGGNSMGVSLLVLILIPAGIFFTLRLKFMPVRKFPEMVRISLEKKTTGDNSISGLQALIIATATRVGMGNLMGVVAAVSAGGAGAVFWMWITAMLGSSTAFAEASLAQIHKQKDPLYGGYRGGPAYYIHDFFTRGKGRRYSVIAVLFALSGLLCWCGISQVISNSVTSAFENAFRIPPIYTTVVLVALAAVIVLRKNATVKVLDVIVPIMAGCYFF
ncbi:MAG: sodium:alanine symporter family protein, partial [Firmicutes bacterium]|nr:sodium:alanine symporter family protein [Bacillota bacterium]